jgi:NADH-quinone oxidoreductase subunit I
VANVVTGLLKGMAVTAKELKDTITKGPVTVQYPRVKEAPTPRARGVISLVEENCTVCMLCARQCPVWCIYIEGHKDFRPPKREGGKPSSWNYLDRFDIDYSLCMYCGICVEVCPFDALHWSPEYEYSDLTIEGLLHDMKRLGEWEATVPEPQDYEKGAQVKGAKKK